MDANGNPVSGQVINFRVTAGGGTVFAGASSTNSQGIAQERWTLGTVAGTAQTLEVRAVDNSSGAPLVFGTFTAIANAGPPASAVKEGGDAQAGAVGSTLPSPITVKVTDRYGNAAPGTVVSWTIAAGSGSVSGTTSNTDANGVASVAWTLGTTAGAKSLTATVATLSPLIFTASANAAGAASLQILSGSGQTFPVGNTLPSPVVIKVTDQHGNPVTNLSLSVTASPGGSISPDPLVTNGQGEATATWTLGGAVGTQTLTFASPGLSSIMVSATGTAGPAAALSIVSGDRQVGVANQTLAQPLVVKVADTYGNPVANVTVSWNTPTTCGSVTPTTSTTNSSGIAQAQWTLGGSAAACSGGASATIPSARVTFTATVTGSAAGSISAARLQETPSSMPRSPVSARQDIWFGPKHSHPLA